MNAFSWFVLACVAVCAAAPARAAVPPARTPAPGRVKKQNKRQKAAPCATAHGAVFGVKIALSNHFFISNEIF